MSDIVTDIITTPRTNVRNALWNVKNPYQGKYPKALCICSAGLLRSPSIAYVLGNMGWNTRSCGVYDYALILADEVLLSWADHLFFADKEHYHAIKDRIPEGKPFTILNIPDNYEFRDPKLLEIISDKLDNFFIKTNENLSN